MYIKEDKDREKKNTLLCMVSVGISICKMRKDAKSGVSQECTHKYKSNILINHILCIICSDENVISQTVPNHKMSERRLRQLGRCGQLPHT